jgi:tRNA U38,U39,U40 pseudouridine synthase TruA
VISIRVREIQENETENYIRMMNRNLPSDIRILAMCKTKD